MPETTIHCPVDHTELTPFDHQGLHVHECPACKGEWFDGQQLRGAIRKIDGDLRWFDFALFDETRRLHEDAASSRICPRCATPMIRLQYEHSKVTIDKCETCGGVWLDQNELQAIVAYLEQLVVTETASDYAKEAFEQLKQIGAPQHGGIFSEIKDFLVVSKLLEYRWLSEHAQIAKIVEELDISWPHF
jgi:Zn-finger nucleic acid-binding protein